MIEVGLVGIRVARAVVEIVGDAVIVAIDHTFPGTYLPRFETSQIRAASLNCSVSPAETMIRRHVSIRSAYVAMTIAVAAAIQPHWGCSVDIRDAALDHWPLSERKANQTMAAASNHCAATKALRRVLVNHLTVYGSVSAGC
jgi:hypothetical protein